VQKYPFARSRGRVGIRGSHFENYFSKLDLPESKQYFEPPTFRFTMSLAPWAGAVYKHVEVFLDYSSFTEDYFISVLVMNEVCSHYTFCVCVCVRRK
jgi:hypothetical protein